jgi:MFS family permease
LAGACAGLFVLMLDRKRVFLAGMVLFAIGSVVSGAAGDQDALILGRVLQGAGAAPMLSLSLALVCNVFPSEEQPRALGIWAAVSAIALAIGPLAGGLLIELDWRVIFWMNLPVLALGAAITVAAAPESTDPAAGAAFHALLGDGHSFAAAVADSTWVAVVLCAIGTTLTWAYVRDPGKPPAGHLHHHMHHRRFHL